MLLLGKVALGAGATLALAAAYVFHEGVIRVDVDENRPGGQHVHLWVPATSVSLGMHLAKLAPHEPLEKAGREVRPYIPLLCAISKELAKYPNADLIEVQNSTDHVRVRTVNGKLLIDAVGNDQVVHVSLPVETLEDVVDRLQEYGPRSWDDVRDSKAW